MKLSFHVSPNYRDVRSTSDIMKDLTLCLLAVATFSAVWYGVKYGAAYGIRVVVMLIAAVVTALATEAVCFKIEKKQDIKTELKHSYGWVTAIILVLITKISVSYYAIIIATILCIVFGKLVFGGFGQNIFNPAAFGEAIIMNSFADSINADFTTGATPMTTMNGMGWVGECASKFGGYGQMLLGNYDSVIGASCGLLILLCAAYMIWRKVIDWRAPACYLGMIAVMSLIVGLIHGDGLGFLLINLLAGGTLFGAVFMLTDPVTSPVTVPGRMVFGIGAATLTMLIRWKANLPDGVLFSILLMNMLTPAIDKAFMGNQIKDAAKFKKVLGIIAACCVVITLAVGAILKPKAAETASSGAETSVETDGGESTSGIALNGDFTENDVTVTDNGDGTYTCTAKGFHSLQMGEDTRNEAIVTIENGAVKSVEVTTFGDTEGVGDMATKADVLAKYEGLTLEDSVDSVSSATYTHTSIAAMVSAALQAAGK